MQFFHRGNHSILITNLFNTAGKLLDFLVDGNIISQFIMELTNVQKFFPGRSVLITGFSGFLGKAVVEKLLRSCPTIGIINVLIRPKFGMDGRSRLNTILESPIFTRLKSLDVTALNKIRPIEGDITLPNLGLKDSDRLHLIKTVSIVIHSAASVKFNDPIKVALNINYHGTRRVMDLCYEIKNLVSFVHVSTAYCNCDLEHVKEAIVPTTIRAEDIDSVSAEEAIKLTPIWLGGKPNTYTLTKCLAENLLQEKGEKLPISIVRPSIIGATWREPEPGYVDSTCGFTGILAAIGKGLLTCICAEEDKVIDIIPLDVVANIIIAVAYDTATNTRPLDIPIYNCCSGTLNPTTIKSTIQNFLEFGSPHFKNTLQQPKMCYKTSLIQTLLINFVTSFLPCWAVDMMAWVRGTNSNMRKLYHKIIAVGVDLCFFGCRQWSFETKNMDKLTRRLGGNDKSIFFTNLVELDWQIYMENYRNGIQKWIYKEDAEME